MEKVQKAESLSLQNEHLQRALRQTSSALQEKIVELSVITRLNACLGCIHDLRALGEKVVTIIVEETIAENCSIMLLDNEQMRLFLLAANDQMDKRYVLASNTAGDKENRLYSFRVGEGVAGRAIATGKTIYVPDTLVSGFFMPKDPSRVAIRTLLSIPLVVDEKAIAAINLSHPNANAFTDSDVRIMEIMADFIAAVINNAILYNQLCTKNTELKSSLEEISSAKMQLFQSQKLAALGVMAGGIAHEIRNPLAICSSGAQFLLEDDITADFRKECAEKILAGIQRASHIIENLLGFARVSTITEMVEMDLLHVLKETITLIDNQARIQKIRLSAHLPANPALIIGNASLLQQVFVNLFLNAINAMPDGGTLIISVERWTNELLVRVSDTGCGIPTADIHNVFDPFYKQSLAGKGTGLGLSICYSIVKRHFGSIEIDSVEGKGATFTVRLPTVQLDILESSDRAPTKARRRD